MCGADIWCLRRGVSFSRDSPKVEHCYIVIAGRENKIKRWCFFIYCGGLICNACIVDDYGILFLNVFMNVLEKKTVTKHIKWTENH